MSTARGEIKQALRPLLAAPETTAVFTDLDGTLAEIVDRPGEASIDPRGAAALERIVERYALTAVISGRRCAEARRIAGVDGLAYVGNHGAERIAAGASEPEPVEALEGLAERATRFVERLDAGRLDRAGISIEDKGPIRALHWRAASDRETAEAEVAEVERAAEAEGLHTHSGRMVLEIRPPVEIDKGIGLRELVERAGPGTIRNVFYGGDDHTDVDAFAAMSEMVAEGEIDRAVAVGVLSSETPEEVARAATVTVAGVEGYVELLELLARPGDRDSGGAAS